MNTIRIATRKSPLAVVQADGIRDCLIQRYPQLEVELLTMLTKADKLLATPLSKIGGKGLFVKELEKAILEHQADIAVHSIKDMPADLPDGLMLAIICKREDPRDCFVSNHYENLFALPQGATVGTSSLRRQAQVLALRSDLNIVPLRGNVGTRLDKLDKGDFDAIILAAAGLKRLNLTDRIAHYFSIDEILPAAGQGAIGIECRASDKTLLSSLSYLDNHHSRQEVLAERAMTAPLGGSCQFPIAAYASCHEDLLTLRGLVADPSGVTLLRTQQSGPVESAAQIGLAAAQDLIAQGAKELLEQVLRDE
jgi:hydroxymethylbilane synthase